jgi:hypothetical protein
VDRINILRIGAASNIEGSARNQEIAFDLVYHLLQDNVGKPVKLVIAQIPAGGE